MSLQVGELVAVIRTDDRQFNDGVDRAGGRWRSLMGTVGKLAVAGAATAGAALAGLAFAGLKQFASLQRGMNEVFTLMPGITADAMSDMTDQVRDFSREFGVLPDEVVPALYQAISAGVPEGNVFDFLEVAQKAALGGVTDLETAVDGISSVVNAYGEDVIDAAKASDLMFCLRTDQRVVTVDRGLVPIGELTEGAWVLAYDGQQFVEAWADYVPQPNKPTVRVQTRLGREIVTTPNHPYLVQRCRHGTSCQRHTCKRTEWVEVQDLQVGDKIAVPTALGQTFGRTAVPEHEAGLLGLWLAEGNSKLASVTLTSTAYGDDVKRWADEWGCTVTPSGDIQHRIVSKGTANNPVTDWLRGMGLGDCTAGTKHVPGVAFTWDRASTATLLRWMFNGDGWLSATEDKRRAGGYGYQLGFCSKSERLVRDVSHLLLRFGIVGRVRFRTEVNAWCWETNRYNEIARFLDHIGIDRESVEIFHAYEPAKQRHRENVVEFDPITEIEPLADAPVADLHVADLHNFVAEDIVAHNTAVRLGKTDFGQLSQSLFQVIPTAAALGVNFGDITAAMAQMTAQGVPTRVATTQVRQLLVEMSKSGSQASDAFKELAGVGMAEFMEQGGNLADALDIMQQAADDNNVSLQDMFGSVEAGQAALALASGGTDAYREALDEMAGAAGATEEAHKTMDTGLSRAWERIKTNVMVALGEIGEALAPTFQGFADWVQDNMPAITDTVVGTFEKIAEFIEGPFKDAWDTLSGALSDNQENFEEAAGALAELFSSVSELIGTVASGAGEEWERIGEDSSEGASELARNIGVILQGFTELVNVVTWAVGVVDSAFGGVVTAWNWLLEFFEKVGRVHGQVMIALAKSLLPWVEAVRTTRETIGGLIDGIVAWFEALPGRIVAALGDPGEMLFDVGSQIMGGFLSGLQSRFETIKTTLQGMTGRLPDWKGPASVDRHILDGPARQIMEGFAERLASEAAAKVRPSLAGITASLAIPVPQMAAAGAGAGAGGMVFAPQITVQAGMGADGDQIGATIVRHLTDWVRRNGGDNPFGGNI